MGPIELTLRLTEDGVELVQANTSLKLVVTGFADDSWQFTVTPLAASGDSPAGDTDICIGCGKPRSEHTEGEGIYASDLFRTGAGGFQDSTGFPDVFAELFDERQQPGFQMGGDEPAGLDLSALLMGIPGGNAGRVSSLAEMIRSAFDDAIAEVEARNDQAWHDLFHGEDGCTFEGAFMALPPSVARSVKVEIAQLLGDPEYLVPTREELAAIRAEGETFAQRVADEVQTDNGAELAD